MSCFVFVRCTSQSVYTPTHPPTLPPNQRREREGGPPNHPPNHPPTHSTRVHVNILHKRVPYCLLPRRRRRGGGGGGGGGGGSVLVCLLDELSSEAFELGKAEVPGWVGGWVGGWVSLFFLPFPPPPPSSSSSRVCIQWVGGWVGGLPGEVDGFVGFWEEEGVAWHSGGLSRGGGWVGGWVGGWERAVL